MFGKCERQRLFCYNLIEKKINNLISHFLCCSYLNSIRMQSGEKVVLACPTARAAQVLEKVTQTKVTTIHRLLEWMPNKHTFTKNAYNKLDADTVRKTTCLLIALSLLIHLTVFIHPSIPPSTPIPRPFAYECI
jgi:hypothetical protein